jgi:hypothetical protein
VVKKNIWMPRLSVLDVTQTLKEAEVADATKVIKELFSMEPQKAVVSAGHVFTCAPVVLPQ